MNRQDFPSELSEYFDLRWDNRKIWALQLPVFLADVSEFDWLLDLPFLPSDSPTHIFERWLGKLSLEKYVAVFTQAEIVFSTLPYLTDDDLKELGLPLGPRRKVSESIKRLREETDLYTADPSASAPEYISAPTLVTP